ncbi:hypothetical protein LXL04_005766 [Taraxacum kok-saghyz]
MGTRFPRSYYKCSYNKVEKCMATKQVKRRDENPRVFEITYKGIHTCNNNVARTVGTTITIFAGKA